MLTSIATVVAVAALTTSHAVSAASLKFPKYDLVPRDDYSAYITNHTSTPVHLKIETKSGQRNATAPLLYGWQIEDISHSIEGGLYAELISNRAFQGSTSPDGTLGEVNLNGYKPIGGAVLALELGSHPLTPAIPNAMKITFPRDARGEVGFENYGFWGMNVAPQLYNATFYIQAADEEADKALASCTTSISLRSNVTNDVWFSQSIDIPGTKAGNWTKVFHQFKNTVQAPTSNNTFAVTFDGAAVAGKTFFVTFISLFPETFDGRRNGMRKDLAEDIYALKPTFLRMPGGNNIEGQTIDARWKWNETIGPVEYRMPRQGDWGYLNTNGFGLLEYLEWCESMDLEPVMAIYSGYSLAFPNTTEGASVPENEMGWVLQAALDQIEYTMGDVNTTWGARRAADGHPEPFKLNYVELGNEDWFSSTYPYRFPILYNGIKAAYPELQLISTAYDEAEKMFNYTIDLPPGIMWDTHQYSTPSFFTGRFNYFDNWQQETNNTNVTVLIGEYSNFQLDTPDGYVNFTQPYLEPHIFFPELISAVSESIYLLGAERNPDVVKMTCYAPTFANFANQAWQPNLVTFTADPSQTILSASYYMQTLLNRFRGDETLPVKNTRGDFDPLFWVSTFDKTTGSVYLKVTNAGNTTVPLTVDLDTPVQVVNGTILTNSNDIGFNYFNNKTAIVPKAVSPLPSVSHAGTTTWTVPAYSVTVLQFHLK